MEHKRKYERQKEERELQKRKEKIRKAREEYDKQKRVCTTAQLPFVVMQSDESCNTVIESCNSAMSRVTT